MPLAFSYLRFSSPQQAAGDSVRRQTAAAIDWCRRNKIELDTSLSLRDEGVSAYRGKHRENPDTHALAGFLQAVRLGRVPNGSYLIVESLDRLSREKIRPALTLLLNLIESGIKVVQLLPAETVYDEDVEPMQLMMAVMELNRGHSESRMKSERVGSAWARKRKDAATKLVTKRVPGWVEVRDDGLGLNEAKAAVVRRVFNLCIAGHGVQAIARTLNAERVPVLGRKAVRGRKVVWNETVVYHVLKSRAAFGEYQPCKGRGSTRTPSGPPIKGYYPAAIDYATFLRARAALASRTRKGVGRRGKHVNLFAGLLVDVQDEGSFTYQHVGKRSTLVPVGAKQGKGTPWTSFPAVPFETAVLSQLREVTAADVQGEVTADDRVRVLEARKAELEGLVAAWTARMDNVAIVETVTAKLSEYTAELGRVSADLTAAQLEAATPASEAWTSFRSLADLLERDNSDEVRVRVKAAIRRVVARVLCGFGYRNRRSYACVRVEFVTGRFREYVVIYEAGRSNGRVKRPGKLFVRSAAAEPGKRLVINYEELGEQYCREVLGIPSGGG